MNRAGKLIKERRLKKNITQWELAYDLGLSTAQFISNIERGRAPLPAKYIPKLSSCLKVSAKTLMEANIKDYYEKMEQEVAGAQDV